MSAKLDTMNIWADAVHIVETKTQGGADMKSYMYKRKLQRKIADRRVFV